MNIQIGQGFYAAYHDRPDIYLMYIMYSSYGQSWKLNDIFVNDVPLLCIQCKNIVLEKNYATIVLLAKIPLDMSKTCYLTGAKVYNKKRQ